ncbi:MAG TPA: DNA lyase [Chloroflexi bacterium]|jgi:endonuclease-8|nr:DNA lyase [Chloroflexota bacterium]HAL26323.1 DNA lyase [Chloroflexota bacterium]
MPEGDTIFRAATGLRRAIGGKVVTGFRSDIPAVAARAAGVIGRTVTAIDPYGKHLLMRFHADGAADLVLHSHMHMEGQWHIYRPGERWWRGASRARAVIETADFVAPCFDAPTVELLTDPELARHPWMRSLGPDAMADDFDEDAALARLRARADAPIGVAIMDQRAFTGVGNVYKSEVLFIRRISPFAEVHELSDDGLRELIVESRDQLRANRTGAWPRTTRLDARRGEELWVYDRAGKPCRVCGSTIALRRQGDAGRATYYCPSCQAGRARPAP